MMNNLPSLSPSDIDKLPLYRWEEYKRLLAKHLKDKADAQKQANSDQKAPKTPNFKMPRMPKF